MRGRGNREEEDKVSFRRGAQEGQCPRGHPDDRDVRSGEGEKRPDSGHGLKVERAGHADARGRS